MTKTARPNSIAREAQRTVKRLAQANACAEPRPATGTFVLVVNGVAKQQPEISRAAIAHALARGWLAARGERIVLSEAGAKWLRRTLATGDPFRAQHQELVPARGEDGRQVPQAFVNAAESPLAWLRRRADRDGRSLISDEAFAAGERLRADYSFAGLTPRVTANWGAPAGSRHSRRASPHGAHELRDEVLAARERVNKALRSVGPELSGILLDVCCYLKGLESAEREQGWPQRSAKVVLQLALAALARHYGFGGAKETGPSAGARVLHWGAEDYRPTLAEWQSPNTDA